MEGNKNYFKKVKKSGIIPGTEIAIIKMVVGAVVLVFGYLTFVSGYNDYQSVVQENSITIIKEIQNNDTNFPPLETLTNILYATKNMNPQSKVNYLLDHKNEILTVLNKNSNISEEQLKNINEIIDFLTKEINDTRIKTNKQALIDFMAETKNYLEKNK